MLDTDSVSYALRGTGGVGAKIVEHAPSELCVSSITLSQLRYGASRRKSARIHSMIDVFVANIAVLPFDENCATHFGILAADLAARGTPIGEFDVLIAAHALTVDATLVTNNVKHFARVRELTVENWL
jgi:tRNA(fMet)-specific endonuclease VapC